MGSCYLAFFAIFIISVSGEVTEESKLLSVVQVFRHGERTPVVFYPTDPYEDSSYWDGLATGQLTNNGKVELTELGQFFRNRYDGFVSTDYLEEEIKMNTVSGNRNLQSAEAFLTGLYPDSDSTVSIPIHKTSVTVLGSLTDCLKYDIEWVALGVTHEYFRKINEDNSEDYKYIREHSDFPVLELAGAYAIWDTLHIENRFNYTLPEWTDSVFPEKLTKMSEMYALSLCYDTTLQKLGAGGFINELIEQFKSVLSGDPSQKIQLYSAHDTNLACFLSTLGAFSDPHIPDFASSLIFELREDSQGNYVNTYYKPDDELVPIKVRSCAYDCRIEDFFDILDRFAMTKLDWIWECYL